jgi:hypothetical protein
MGVVSIPHRHNLVVGELRVVHDTEQREWKIVVVCAFIPRRTWRKTGRSVSAANAPRQRSAGVPFVFQVSRAFR